ncbi:MAG: hypothetical protein RSH52_31025 [Janthinobacterium sp.]
MRQPHLAGGGATGTGWFDDSGNGAACSGTGWPADIGKGEAAGSGDGATAGAGTLCGKADGIWAGSISGCAGAGCMPTADGPERTITVPGICVGALAAMSGRRRKLPSVPANE